MTYKWITKFFHYEKTRLTIHSNKISTKLLIGVAFKRHQISKVTLAPKWGMTYAWPYCKILSPLTHLMSNDSSFLRIKFANKNPKNLLLSSWIKQNCLQNCLTIHKESKEQNPLKQLVVVTGCPFQGQRQMPKTNNIFLFFGAGSQKCTCTSLQKDGVRCPVTKVQKPRVKYKIKFIT